MGKGGANLAPEGEYLEPEVKPVPRRRSRADMSGTMGIDYLRGSRTAETKLGPGLPPGPKIVFLFFEAFFSFVNTKEKKAYFPRPFKGGIPAGVRAEIL